MCWIRGRYGADMLCSIKRVVVVGSSGGNESTDAHTHAPAQWFADDALACVRRLHGGHGRNLQQYYKQLRE